MNAGSGSGTPAVPENSAAFWKEEFKNSLLNFHSLKKGS
jgi:hypothetical protein